MNNNRPWWQYWLALLVLLLVQENLSALSHPLPISYSLPNYSKFMFISKENQARLLQQLQQVNQLLEANRKSNLPTSPDLERLVTQYNQYYHTCCEKMGWSLPAFAGQAANNSHPPTSTPQDIDCSNFTTAVVQWRADMFKFFREKKTSHAEVKINTQLFKQELALCISSIPIVNSLYQEWQDLLSTLPDSTTGKELFTALLSNTGATWKMTNDIQALETHYKKNRKTYKKHEGDTEGFQRSIMPKEKYFLDALKASTSTDDPYLPENLEEQGEQLEEEMKIIQYEYKTWLKETIKDINSDTNGIGKTINPSLLVQQRTQQMESPSYAQEFWEDYGQAVEKAILKEPLPLSYEKAAKIATQLLKEHFNAIYSQEDKAFFRAALDSKEADMPDGLNNWLLASLNRENYDFVAFQEAYRAWAHGVTQVVAACENQLKGKDFRIDKSKLEKELTTLLSYNFQQVTPGLDIWKHLKRALPAQPTFSFDTLHNTWVDAVNTIQTDAFIQALWETYITSNTQITMTEASSSFLNKLPSKESFINAILDARYVAPKATVPQLEIANKKNTIEVLVTIPLRPVPLLIGSATQQISDETGFTSLVAMLKDKTGETELSIDTNGGIENLAVRLAKSMVIKPTIPMKVIHSQQSKQPIVVPMALKKDSIKFTGNIDSYYSIQVGDIDVNTKEPTSIGKHKYQQTLMIPLVVVTAPISVNVETGAVLVGAGAEINKQAKQYSIDLELVIESTYEEAKNSYTIQFSQKNRDATDHGAVITGMTLSENNSLTLPVYKK